MTNGEVADPQGDAESAETAPHQRPFRKTAAFVGTAFAAYLALSVVLWWHVWSGSPSADTTCACNDPSLFAWFLEWPAYAIAHGHNPFFSRSLFYPTGFNLISNTGVFTLGIPLAPVTWIFGPILTLNVVYTLAPALTATSMFWLLRRWVTWTPASFIGGLVFGFSPFAFANLAVAHFNTEMLVFVPLIVGCLDEILLRQRRTWKRSGIVLAVLLVLQFFLSTEMLAIVAVTALLGLIVLVVHTAVVNRSELFLRFPHASKAIGFGIAISAVLLAYPIWFDLDGPAHLSGVLWPTIVPGTGGIVLGDLWNLHYMNASALQLYAGYEGRNGLPEGEYLGIGLLCVLVFGLVLFWRSRKVWYFAVLALLSATFCLGLPSNYWIPWKVLAHIPVVQNIAVARFFAMPTFCLAAMLGLILDRLHGSIRERVTRSHPTSRQLSRRSLRRGAIVASVFATAVSAIAVVPMATAVADNVPFTVESLSTPAWVTNVGSHLPSNQVVLIFPPPVSGGEAMTWQAIDLMRYSMATGGGPESIPARAGREEAGFEVITDGSLVFSPIPPATPKNVEAVRSALAGWGVDDVVIPNPETIEPSYDRSANTSWALGIFTLAIGRKPHLEDDAWVWNDVSNPDRKLNTPESDFSRCTAGEFTNSVSYAPVAPCVYDAAHR